MRLIFCADPFDIRRPDPAFEAEVAAAEGLGLDIALVSFEDLVAGELDRAVRRVPAQPEPTIGIYRGWMLRPEHYRALYDALAARGIHLINDPDAYRHCHYLPEGYPAIEQWTPRSVWLPAGAATDEIMAALRPFGAGPVVVKDYVKSQKHYWDDACYIPSAADRETVERVVRRFLQLQGDDLNEGLVFREFVELEPLGRHSRSGMPLTKEFRIFFLDDEPIAWSRYWSEGDYGDLVPPIEQFRSVARGIASRFFTMDVAKRRDGDWLIVELGDGQVAGLPDDVEPGAFYRALSEAVRA